MAMQYFYIFSTFLLLSDQGGGPGYLRVRLREEEHGD